MKELKVDHNGEYINVSIERIEDKGNQKGDKIGDLS